MTSRKAAPVSPEQKSPARKKAKTAASEATQTGIGAFLQSPPKQTGNGSGKKSSSKKGKDADVIDLLSDNEDEDCKPSTSKKPLASTSRASHDVIDLDGVESESDSKPAPKKSNGAPLHPMFAARPISIDDEDDVKDVKPDIKGKGKAKPQDSPTKLIIPESSNGEPIVYPLDTDIFAFDAKTDISTATWPRSGAGKLQIPYSFLVAAFVLVSATRSRLSIVTVLTNTLRTVVEYQPEILRETVYLVS